MSFADQTNYHALHVISRARLEASQDTFRTTTTEDPSIPAENALTSLNNPSKISPSAEFPSVGQCAVHLELLEVFYVLQQTVLKSEAIDTFFGIEPEHSEVKRKDGETRKLKDSTLWKRREVKWQRYVEFAVVRFLKWQRQLPHLEIPPLDILMVWHSFLLNPRLFRNFFRGRSLSARSLPWEQIHLAINRSDWSFTLPREAGARFERGTSLPSDLFKAFSNDYAIPQHSLDQLAHLSLDDSESIDRSSLVQSKPRAASNNWADFHLRTFHEVDRDLAIQLRDAVVRQMSFITKMNAHLWIRSPALEGTLRRAITRYTKFLKLMALYPKTMFVPTLDIDLVWHTHQCSPSQYFDSTNKLIGRFLNHDDTIVKDKLEDGFANTKALFQVRFGKSYPICGCWDCEALLSALESPVLDVKGEPDMEKIAQSVHYEVAYHRAVELARRRKSPFPVHERSV